VHHCCVDADDFEELDLHTALLVDKSIDMESCSFHITCNEDEEGREMRHGTSNDDTEQSLVLDVFFSATDCASKK